VQLTKPVSFEGALREIVYFTIIMFLIHYSLEHCQNYSKL